MRSAEAIAVEALSLPADERAAEVAARIEAVRAGTAETITTAEALAQARTRLSARRG
jgi:hypothetical protein